MVLLFYGTIVWIHILPYKYMEINVLLRYNKVWTHFLIQLNEKVCLNFWYCKYYFKALPKASKWKNKIHNLSLRYTEQHTDLMPTLFNSPFLNCYKLKNKINFWSFFCGKELVRFRVLIKMGTLFTLVGWFVLTSQIH